MDNQTFMGLLIVGGIILVLNQSKEDKVAKKEEKPDIRGPDIDMEKMPPIQYRTDLLQSYREWLVYRNRLVSQYDQEMRKIIVWGSANPNLTIDQMRDGYPEFETMFPAYIKQFKDLGNQGEDIMAACNLIQDHYDPAYMTHTKIQLELAPVGERLRSLTDFWDMLNRRYKEEQKKKVGYESYGDVSDKFKTAEMDLSETDFAKKDDDDFFTISKKPLETFLDAKTTPSKVGDVKPAFAGKAVAQDHADDTHNFGSPASNATAIPTMDYDTFNTTNTPLVHAAIPKFTMPAQDKPPAAPDVMVQARPGKPEGPLKGFVQGNLPTHTQRADESLSDEEGVPLKSLDQRLADAHERLTAPRFQTPQETDAAIRKLKKAEAVERGKMGLIDFNDQTYTLTQIEAFVNRLDRGSHAIPTSLEAALKDYDQLSNAVNTLDAIITTDEMAGGRFSSEEARAVKMIASAALTRYAKMIHDQFQTSVKTRNEKTFPVEWLDATKKAKFGSKEPAPQQPGSG